MVKIGELKENLDSLKTFVENMHKAIPAAIAAVGAGTTANGATGQSIMIKNMENTKIKQ